MRAVRFLAAISLTTGLVTVVACQEPTQVTVEVRLDTAKCSEIHGTAINVGVFPEDTQRKVLSKYPNAETTDCDDASQRIGTLVVTPSEEERGSIIVVTSYGQQRNPTECQPPEFKDCIVARRQFTFTKHRRLFLPITIDPTCVNVPCDAFSTCRKGACFPSEAEPCEAGEKCLEPGETATGGTDRDAAIDPDTGITTPKPVASCPSIVLSCGATPCAPGLKCCETSAGAICQEVCAVQHCCTSDDCGGRSCIQQNGSLTNMPDASSGFDDGAVFDGAMPIGDGSVINDDSGGSDGSVVPDGGMDASSGSDAGIGTDGGTGTDGGSGTDAGRPFGKGICAQ